MNSDRLRLLIAASALLAAMSTTTRASAASLAMDGASDAVEHRPVDAADSRPATPLRVLIRDLEVQDIDAALAAQAGYGVSQAFLGRPGYEVLTTADLRTLLSHEQERALLDCAEDSCLTRLSQAVDVQRLVHGSLGRVGQRLVVSLVLIAPESARVLNRVSGDVDAAAPASEVIEQVSALTAQLLGFDQGATAQPFALSSGRTTSFAVFPLQVAGVDESLAKNLTQVLSVEIKRAENTSVVSRDDIAAMIELDRARTALACTSDVSCLVEIGGALGVDMLVVGQVGRVADSWVLSLTVLDVAGVQVRNRVSESFQGDEDQLLGAVRHAGRRLLGLGQGSTGTLQVSATEQASQLSVDGTQRGTLPLPPLEGLPAGRHRVVLHADGYFDWAGDVYLNPDETTALWVRLREKPLAWYQHWWVWAGTGVAAATALGITVGVIYLALVPKAPQSGEVISNLPDPPRMP